MTKTSFIDIDPEEEVLFYKNLVPSDRFAFGRISRKVAITSRKKKKGMTQKSMLPQISELWAGFSEAEKTAWTNAGAEMNLNGWRMFVADQCARIKNGIAGVATPSLFHQSFVGSLIVDDPAYQIKIAQYHPNKYWVSQKIKGSKSMYQPIKVIESFALPLTLSLNYKTNLSGLYGNVCIYGDCYFGACNFGDEAGIYDGRARIWAEVWSSYQGVDRFTFLEIPFDFNTYWKNATATLESVIGHTIGYTLYIEIYNLRGSLFFDNVKITHSGQNWCRDTNCKDIDQGFTRAFFQVPKHWVSVELPVGSWFGSIYPS